MNYWEYLSFFLQIRHSCWFITDRYLFIMFTRSNAHWWAGYGINWSYDLFDLFFHDRVDSFEHSDKFIGLVISFFEIIIVSIELSYDGTEVVVFGEEVGDFFFEDEILVREFFGFSAEACVFMMGMVKRSSQSVDWFFILIAKIEYSVSNCSSYYSPKYKRDKIHDDKGNLTTSLWSTHCDINIKSKSVIVAVIKTMINHWL